MSSEKDILNAIERLEKLEASGSIRPNEAKALEVLRGQRDAAQESAQAFDSRMMGVAHDFTFGFPEALSGAVAAGKAAFAGEPMGPAYTEARDATRGRYQDAFTADPEGFRSGQLAGAGLSMLLPGLGIVGATKGRPAMQTIAMMLAGGADGANQGIQDAQIDGRPLDTIGDYWDAAKVPMAVGATLGAGVRGLGAGSGALARIGSEATQTTAAPGVGRYATSVLGRYTDDLADAGIDLQRYFDDLTPEAMLADVPQVRPMAAGLADIGGPGGAQLGRSINDRATEAGTRIQGELDARIAQPDAAFDAKRALALERTSRLGPEYDAVLSASGARLDARPILQRLDNTLSVGGPKTTPLLTRYRNDLASAVDENGMVDPVRLHFIRSDLSDELRELPRGTKLSATIANGLEAIDEVLDTIPGYPEARTGYANNRAMERAIDEGKEVLRGGRVSAMTPNEVRDWFSGLSTAQQEAARKGLRADIAALMGTARNDAAAAWGEFAKGWNEEKLRIILGDAAADPIIKRLRSEQVFSQTRGEVLANSRTNRAAEASERLAPAKDPATGDVPNPISRLRRAAFDEPVNMMVNQALYGGRANALNRDLGLMLSAQGPARDRIIQALLANQGVRANSRTYEEIVNLLSGAAANPAAAVGSSATK